MGGASGHDLMLNVTTESFLFSLVWSTTPLALRQQRDFILISHLGIASEAHAKCGIPCRAHPVA